MVAKSQTAKRRPGRCPTSSGGAIAKWRPLARRFRERPAHQQITALSGTNLINTAPNRTSGLAEVATIHSPVHSPSMPVGDGLRGIDINRNTA